jgi:hypothetical protein
MSTWGDKLRSTVRPNLGVGVPVPPGSEPKPESIIHNDWRQGLVTYESPEDVPNNGAVDLQDVESLDTDALIRAPGIAEVEDVSPRVLDWIFEHASINFATALIAIDPPFLGVKTTALFVFTDEGLDDTGEGAWHVVNVAGFLLFSNGITASYIRDWDTEVITDVTAEIIAKTFGNAFGRTFAGAWTDPVDGLQALGIRWNASNADPADWSGIGSGDELLISNQPEADRIVALRPIGFDVLAILGRRNLWLGYETGEADRPADFRIRFPGVGCVWERTAVITPDGIIFLSDDGVRLFNINETKILSGAINDRLLPLDYLNLDQYYAVYNPQVSAYQLYTPTGVFIYQLPLEIEGFRPRPGRWYFRSYVGNSAVIFNPQSNNLFWSSVLGQWIEQLLTWAEMSIGEDLAPPVVYNGQGSLLGVENYGTENYFDDPQEPFWKARQANDRTTELVITQAVEIEYESGAASEISIEVQDEDGNDVAGITKTLPSSSNKRISRMIWFTVTGTGTGFKLNITDGTPEVFRIRHVFDGAAPTTQAL